MDERIRDLQRAAAQGGPAEQAALDQALERLGREAVRFTGPTPPAEPAHRGSRQIDRAESTVSDCLDWGGAPSTRNQADARAFTKRRRRRASRRASRATCRDWDLWE